MNPKDFARDFKGYGPNPPDPKWPGGAKIAISFVINYEEGGEHNILNGDEHSEIRGNDLMPPEPLKGMRDYPVESLFEYGSRAGIWRYLRLFKKYGFQVTIYAIGRALEYYPEMGKAFVDAGHEICSHGYRWCGHAHLSVEEERAQINKAIDSLTEADPTKRAPRGWGYVRASPNSHWLVPEVYKQRKLPLLYSSDCYSDDLPYWTPYPGGEPEDGLLMVPYSLDNNDAKFSANQGFTGPLEFEAHLKNAFDCLYEEGLEGNPKMMTIGLHCRTAARPGRIVALKNFCQYVSSKPHVWVTTRENIAKHFAAQFPYKPEIAQANQPEKVWPTGVC